MKLGRVGQACQLCWFLSNQILTESTTDFLKYWSDYHILNMHMFVLIWWTSFVLACILDSVLVIIRCLWSRSAHDKSGEKYDQHSLGWRWGLSTKLWRKKRRSYPQTIIQFKETREIWISGRHTLVHTRQIYSFGDIGSTNAPAILMFNQCEWPGKRWRKTTTVIISNVVMTGKSPKMHRAKYRWTHTRPRQNSQKCTWYKSSWNVSIRT